MSGGVEIRFTLTQRQADAVLRSKGLSQGYGVRLSVALREADMRLRHAVINALAGHPDGAEQAGERQRTGQTRAGGKG